jgi:hypothetical protein
MSGQQLTRNDLEQLFPEPVLTTRSAVIAWALGPDAAQAAQRPDEKGQPCWKVQKSPDEAGIEDDVAKQPAVRLNRTGNKKLTGHVLPAIEFEDGTILREESNDLVARITEGRLPTGGTAHRSS